MCLCKTSLKADREVGGGVPRRTAPVNNGGSSGERHRWTTGPNQKDTRPKVTSDHTQDAPEHFRWLKSTSRTRAASSKEPQRRTNLTKLMPAEQISKPKIWIVVFDCWMLLLLICCESDLKISISGFWQVKCICSYDFQWFPLVFIMVFNISTFFVFDGFATIWHGYFWVHVHA